MLSKKDIICPENLLNLAKTKGPAKAVIVNAVKPVSIESAKQAVDENLIIPDDSKSILDGALRPWETKVFSRNKKFLIQILSSILEHYKINPNTEWRKIPKNIRNIILNGSNNLDNVKLLSINSITDGSKSFKGIINYIEKKYDETERFWIQHELEKYLSSAIEDFKKGFSN